MSIRLSNGALAVGALLIVAICAVAAWRVNRRPPPSSEGGPSAATRTTSVGAEVFGINLVDAEPALAAGLGARVVRVGSEVGPTLNWLDAGSPLAEEPVDWTVSDAFFTATDAAGVDVLAVIGPWPGRSPARHPQRYLPEDLAAYAAWVARVVERYDGDGVADMPGLHRGVLAWELDEDPDIHHAEAPRDETNVLRQVRYETPAEYAVLALTTSRAIRAADPDAIILLGGMGRATTPVGRQYLDRVVATPGVLDAIDALSLKAPFVEDGVGLLDETMRTAAAVAPGKAVWITETGVPSVAIPDWVTGEWQASMVVAVYGELVGSGAERVFWQALDDSEGEPAEQSSKGLFRAPDRRSETPATKPSAEAYRRLAGIMGPVDLATVVARRVGTDGRLLETDRGWLIYWGDVPTPPGAASGIDLREGQPLPPSSARVPAPAWLAR